MLYWLQRIKIWDTIATTYWACKQRTFTQNIMDNYKLLGRAGEGAHGLVFKGLNLKNNTIVALKQIRLNIHSGIPKNTMREICSLRALQNSKHIVKLIEVFGTDGAVILVMEYLPCSLAEIMKSLQQPLTLSQIKTYTKMILKGLHSMHSKCLMHRDLKPSNLLINNNGLLKIADFGLCRIYNEGNKERQYSHQVATRWYRAPELLYGSKTYNLGVDMWAVGCILGEMINGKPLFPGETDIEQLAIVLATLGTPNEENWPGLSDLPDYNKIAFTPTLGKTWKSVLPQADDVTLHFIENILLYNSNRRLTAEEALKDNFFLTYPQPCNLTEMPKPENIKTKTDNINWQLDNFDDVIK